MTTDLQHIPVQFSGSKWPEFTELSQHGNLITLDLHIPDTLHWFEGHFPKQAVLPGVVQTHWAGALSTHFFKPQGPFKQLRNVKFLSMILPNATLQLQLKWNDEKQNAAFLYAHDDTTHTKGSLQF